RCAGRRVRRRLVADPRLERLHRRHRRDGRGAVREGRPPPPPEPAARARDVTRILLDVDTQVDFVHADGKLAVPDAEAAVPAMARLVEAARAAGIPHVASADDHELTDAEKIAETRQADPVPLALTAVPERWLRGREFLLLKKHFDVFSNPNAERLLDLLDPDEVVLFGVATDVCDDAAIRGLLDRGRR